VLFHNAVPNGRIPSSRSAPSVSAASLGDRERGSASPQFGQQHDSSTSRFASNRFRLLPILYPAATPCCATCLKVHTANSLRVAAAPVHDCSIPQHCSVSGPCLSDESAAVLNPSSHTVRGASDETHSAAQHAVLPDNRSKASRTRSRLAPLLSPPVPSDGFCAFNAVPLLQGRDCFNIYFPSLPRSAYASAGTPALRLGSFPVLPSTRYPAHRPELHHLLVRPSATPSPPITAMLAPEH